MTVHQLEHGHLCKSMLNKTTALFTVYEKNVGTKKLPFSKLILKV
uniref:Uncharacterized protein n=1 Tax=Anguilla anguilla TaxID=7936 RepID=A0A0E9P7U0_ANGAN